jgi:feruloyl esterase
MTMPAWHVLALATATLVLDHGSRASTAPAPSGPLRAVAPVRGCETLRRVDLSAAAGVGVTVTSAAQVQTSAGTFCAVAGTIAPTIGFEVYLPTARWTQRLVQNGCGGLCGSISVSLTQAGGCAPALNGEFVVAATNMGYENRPGTPLGAFATDPQKRIDFAYRANHLTTLVSKALIAAFYGQAPRYSYFSGCSDGGREALVAAQRYPDDFDGISAGAPVADFQVQNSFYHAWVTAANRRADGTPILLAAKLPVLHAAVIAHCDTLDGLADGLLADPRACTVDPAWAACPPRARDTTNCLTPQEQAVVRKIYDGPRDASGTPFWIGGPQPGSEQRWAGGFIPTNSGEQTMSGMLSQAMLRYMIYPQSPAPDDLIRDFAFDAASFRRVTLLHPLNDALNTDLRPFAQAGGRLILWQGWSDASVTPLTSIAYYKALQQQLGPVAAERFVRLYMLPGTGHCGGGDGFSQIDTLTPLIAWVERGQAPGAIIAAKVADRSNGPRGGLPGSSQPGRQTPLPTPDEPPLATRPIYPFPLIPRYSGTGDPTSAANFVPVPSTVREAPIVRWYGDTLLAPNNQRDYQVRDGRLSAGAPVRH